MTDPGPGRCYICEGRISYGDASDSAIMASINGVPSICRDCCKIMDKWSYDNRRIPLAAFQQTNQGGSL